MKVIIDRFEGNFAVVELKDKSFCNMPKLLIPDSAKEGDVVTIAIDENETNMRRQVASDLFSELTKKN